MKRVLTSVLLIACLLLFASTPAAESELAPVMLVLDASGSMWGQIEGKAKIEIARRVIRELMGDWDPQRPVGLMAYGHRRKGDCSDIETLVDVGLNTQAAIIKTIHSLQPSSPAWPRCLPVVSS